MCKSLKRVCASLSDLECVEANRTAYFSRAEQSACSKCPRECDSVVFEWDLFESRYPTQFEVENLKKLSLFKNEEIDILKSVVPINVYFSDLATTYYKEKAAITFEMMIGNVGGNLGLFTGESQFCYWQSFIFLMYDY